MRDRPRILVILKGLAIGGAEKLVLDQAQSWNREAFDYHVAYLESALDGLADEFRAMNVPVHPPRQGGALDPRVLAPFAREVRALGPDLIHAHLPLTGVIVRLLPGLGVPLVYTEHSLPDSYRLATRLANRLTYRRSAAVICVSDAVREAVRRYPCRQVVTVANAVGIPSVGRSHGDVRRELGVQPGTHLVVHVGQIREGKGHRNLLEAARVLTELRQDVVIVSVGGEGIHGELERLREGAAALRLGERLKFVGQRVDAPDLMNAADALVNPSDVEGLPIVILEAMLLGKPVVATDVGGVRSLIEDGVTGLLVPPGRPELLARAINRVLSSPALAATLGSAARDCLKTGFSAEDAVRRIEGIYRSVLTTRPEGDT